MTAAQLAETQAGKRVRPLCKHGDKSVAAAASAVIAAWKECVRREAEGSALPVAAATAGDKDSARVATAGTKDSAPAATAAGKDSAPAATAGPKDRPAFTAAAPALKRMAPTDAEPARPAKRVPADRPAPATPAPVAPATVPATLQLTGDKVRDLVRRTFLAALEAAAGELSGDEAPAPQPPAATAAQAEEELRSQHGGVNEGYKAKFRSLGFNLKDPKNPDLRRKVLLGLILPSLLVTLGPEELASDAQRQENARIREKKLFDSAPSAAKQATTDQFQCGKCRQRKTTYYQMQTRSADEPMTTFVTCLNCNNRWKFC